MAPRPPDPSTQDSPEREQAWDLTRRDFVKGAGAVAGATAVGWPMLSAATTEGSAVRPVRQLPVKLTVNGQAKQVTVDTRTTLLDLLREDLKLTGTKKGCDHGQCGACTVIADGRRINSCLALALAHDGEQITTVEGLADGDSLHPVQQAFLDHDGFQCGYCTPGQLCSAVALGEELKRNSPSYRTANLSQPGVIELNDDEIRERMSGNICRCGAYPGIVAAVRQVYGKG